MKGTKYTICVFAHTSYIFLTYLGNLRPSSKTNSGFILLNCIQEFIQINILLIKMSRYHVSSFTQTLFPSYYKTMVVSIYHLSCTQKSHHQFRGKPIALLAKKQHITETMLCQCECGIPEKSNIVIFSSITRLRYEDNEKH